MAHRTDDVDLTRDRMLVERFQDGDDSAFEVLYRRYFARLQRFCLKRVGDPHAAEEIAQEAFTRAYRALPALGGERRFYPWMTVIAGRLCVDHHRRCARTEPSERIELGAVEGGQEAIVQQADFAVLTAALARVAPRHREVLDLRERKGWSYQQIATHYGVPVGTVEALLFRARRALRREFLAVAGGDRAGRLATLPLVGVGARAFASLKAKLAAAASWLPPALAPALGVAAVVGSAVVIGGAGAPPASERPSAVVRDVAPAHAASVDGPSHGAIAVSGGGRAGRAGAHADLDPPRAGDDDGRPAVTGHVDVTNTSVSDYDTTAARADEEMDLVERVEVAGGEVLVAVDPQRVVLDVLAFASDPGGPRP